MAIKTSNQITFTEHKKIIEIKEYYLATSQSTGVTTETAGWTTDIQTIDYSNKYLWNYEEVVYSIGSSDISEPVIMGFYGKGDAGRGIKNIVNYYQVTQNLVAPELPDANNTSSWSDISVVTTLSPTNKYLWNYEAIVYTDGSVTPTDPAVIGVYGDSGANAVTFEIYSVHGFMFKEDLKSIELQIAAFDGSDAITGATYTWAWWDDTLNNGSGGYVTIVENITTPTLTIGENDDYAFASLKCTMSYQGKLYEDYVVLTSETVVYTAVVKFFDDSCGNILRADDLYTVAYIELFQNNHKIDGLMSNQYWSGLATVSSGTIISNIPSTYSNGTVMYFICKDGDVEYKAVLGQLTSGTWKVIDNTSEYTYRNTYRTEVTSNVIVISKEHINKALNIDFTVYKKKDESFENPIGRTHVSIIDTNDPVVGNEAPLNPSNGQLWIDTSSGNGILYIYNDNSNQWEKSTKQIGGAVFTSRPSSYDEGDLWVLGVNESCGSFGAGSMLKATQSSSTFKASDWIDANSALTQLKKDIEQYFTFNTESGLKVSQNDDKFYVTLGATEMAFVDNSDGNPERVVIISNNSATIRNARLNGNTIINGEMHVHDPATESALFIWKLETNGSYSLAVPN